MRPRDETPYATHVPVLVGLAQVIRVQRVLEFGAGTFSTLLFLNRAAFPDLIEIVTYEDNNGWAKRVATEAAGDDRLTLKTVPLVPDYVPSVIDSFDLIHIDDSATATLRTKTVNSVAAARPMNTLVAIHDFELLELARAARRFDHVYRFRTFTPQVGVAWYGDAISKGVLSEMQRRIAHHRVTLPVTDIAQWAAVLRDTLAQ